MDADSNLIYLKDENFNYLFVNHSFEKYYNKPANEIIGKSDFEISEADLAKQIRLTDQTVLRDRLLIKKEMRYRNNTYIMTKFPAELLNGQWGIGATIQDISAEKQQEQFREKVFERNTILIDILTLSFENTHEQLHYVLQKVLTLTESQHGYLYLYEKKNEMFNLSTKTDDSILDCMIEDDHTLKNTDLWGEVIHTRKPLIINNYNGDHLLKPSCSEERIPLKRFISVPILIDERIVAVIVLGNKQRDYNENDVMNVTILMSGVWQSLQRKRAEEQLARERNKYLQTLISIGDGVLVVDTNGIVEMLNQVAQRLTGWTSEEAVGKHYKRVFLLSHEDLNRSIDDPIEKTIRTNSIQKLENHAVITSRDGTKYFLEDSAAPILGQDGKLEGVVLVFRDVSERKKHKKAIEYLSFHDSLTGLYNRRYFEEALKRIDVAPSLPISIVMADVNGLKLTNDIFGHAHGDILLKTVAEVFVKICRADDIISRWGGDEFALLFPNTTYQEAESILSLLKEQFMKERIKTTKVSVSLGLATKTIAKESILDIMDTAEEKMYSNKTIDREMMREEEIQAIIAMLHELSPRELDHSRNVRALCKRLGKALHLSEVDLRRLLDASYLHDIGKIVLEQDLLYNSNPLTEEEKIKLRRHPIVGYRILNSSNHTLDLAETVLTHHESWDGSGYPKRLKREEIPLFSRIIAVVGSYEEALYQTGTPNAESKQQAIQLIRNGIGTQFDPNIANLFIHLMETEFELANSRE